VDKDTRYYVLYLLVFVVLYSLAMSLTKKKVERYFLPALVIIDVVAAYGLVNILKLFYAASKDKVKVSFRSLFIAFLVIFTVIRVLTLRRFHPYYGVYANPLFGGFPEARKHLRVITGEELSAAADYLNQKPGASEMVVATPVWRSLQPFFKGRTVDSDDIFDGESDYGPLDPDYYVFAYQGHDWDKGDLDLVLEKKIYLVGHPVAGVYTVRGK